MSESNGRVRILAVVEDHPDMRALVRMILERSGAAIESEASSAEEALEVIDPDGTGVVVLDNHLSGELSGLEAAPLIAGRSPGARIILFTALDFASEASSEPSVAAYLRKDRISDLPALARRVLADGAV